MAATIPPSLRSALERLKNAGAVNGLLLGWRRQVLINLLPFEEFRAERLLQEVHDARTHFASGGDREVKTLWFGFESVHILVVFWEESTLAVLHSRAEEADFLRRTAQTCLEDAQLLIDSLLNPPAEDGAGESPQHQGELTDESDSKTNLLSRIA